MGQGEFLCVPFQSAEFDLLCAKLKSLAQIPQLLVRNITCVWHSGMSGHIDYLTRLGPQPIGVTAEALDLSVKQDCPRGDQPR